MPIPRIIPEIRQTLVSHLIFFIPELISEIGIPIAVWFSSRRTSLRCRGLLTLSRRQRERSPTNLKIKIRWVYNDYFLIISLKERPKKINDIFESYYLHS